jgi:hydrogenase expression/formation protein HypE
MTMADPVDDVGSCPIPISDYPHILLAHGGGGSLMHQLLEKMFLPAFRNPQLEMRHDGAVLGFGDRRLALTTDSYVVRPLFFPGGDIGTLAVDGTVNDLAMCGARPLYLSAGFIIEEGLSMDTLWRIVRSMELAARAASVEIVTGDTKVVDKGKGDGLFINTAGIGIIEPGVDVRPGRIRPGDVVLLSGDVGRHGVAVLLAREELAIEAAIESDLAPLAEPVMKLLDAGVEIHCLRDLTRGGLATGLVELSRAAELGFRIDERAIPVHEDVTGVCELLGLDPLYVANEGRFVAVVSPDSAELALDVMRSHPLGSEAAVIGQVTQQSPGRVSLRSAIGATRALDLLSGEQLPRIC